MILGTCGPIQAYLYAVMSRELRKNNGMWHVLDSRTYEVLSAWPANQKDRALEALRKF